MMDVNLLIANNILAILKKQGRKQAELADGIGVSRATMSKMLNGGRSINAVELKKIADFLNSSMDTIMSIPEISMETDAIHAFMGKVETPDAREALKVADKVSDLIVFHTRVRKNGNKMLHPVED
jgi:transcriptional regulator with XRE-family HTH domain